MSDELFEGIIFNKGQTNEKRFPFVRITVAKQVKIINKFKPTIRNAVVQFIAPSKINFRMWRKVRSVAFIKTGLWKWFGFLPFEFIIPKELRCNEILLDLAGELQASFFRFVAAAVKGHDEPLLSLKNSQTENKEVKSEG
jgi:hypothetical protein